MPLKNSCKHPCTEVYMTYYHLKVTHCCYIFYHNIHAHLDNYTKLTCNIISHIENAITHTHTRTHTTRAHTHTLLQVICLPAGPNVQRLHSSPRCAFSLSFP